MIRRLAFSPHTGAPALGFEVWSQYSGSWGCSQIFPGPPAQHYPDTPQRLPKPCCLHGKDSRPSLISGCHRVQGQKCPRGLALNRGDVTRPLPDRLASGGATPIYPLPATCRVTVTGRDEHTPAGVEKAEPGCRKCRKTPFQPSHGWVEAAIKRSGDLPGEGRDNGLVVSAGGKVQFPSEQIQPGPLVSQDIKGTRSYRSQARMLCEVALSVWGPRGLVMSLSLQEPEHVTCDNVAILAATIARCERVGSS
jgi:hypothetical protein